MFTDCNELKFHEPKKDKKRVFRSDQSHSWNRWGVKSISSEKANKEFEARAGFDGTDSLAGVETNKCVVVIYAVKMSAAGVDAVSGSYTKLETDEDCYE